MYLTKDKLQHLSTVTHEGKVVVLAVSGDGLIYYTVKQDGFEDSYLNTPPDQRTGWENWQALEFPDEEDDQSVIETEKAKLTYQQDTSKYLLKSRYKTKDESAVAPVQVISALEHIYVFRQSKTNTLLVDRFVLDGMTNKLNRKLEVRFKRSRQKYKPTKNMNKGSNGLVNIDTLDYRDANGNFFYEPTTELCLVNNLLQGWFSVVLVPTVENDVYRWHIFAYNSQTQKVELTTIRGSEEGLFDVQDYTVFAESNSTLVPDKIPGLIKRSLDINGVKVTNGLSATKYDLQQEQETQFGEKQLLKTSTKLMLAVPTDKGTAALSFAIAGNGTLAEIDKTPERTIIRSRQREILLPLNTLDEIKGLADKTPPPQGMITGLAVGTDAENAEDLVKISTEGKAGELANGDLVKITGTSDYQGLYSTKKIDDHTFEIDLSTPVENLGYWEKEDPEAAGLIFDGMIAAYQKANDGKLRVICENHGLENGDEVQIIGTDAYDDTYPVKKIDDTHFVIERKWAKGEAVNVKVVSRKRRGVVFDGIDDYVEITEPFRNIETFTISAWIKPAKINTGNYQALIGKQYDQHRKPSLWISPNNGGLHYDSYTTSGEGYGGIINNFFDAADTWVHVAWVKDGTKYKFYKNGEEFAVQDAPKSFYTEKKSSYWLGKVDTYFPGQIAEVRIWSVARSATEIKNNMYLQLRGKEVGLEGYWRLGGISEGKVIDFSANGNDGTVYGDPYVSAATLNRKLTGGSDAVKYSNPELFAVSQRSTYEESFEFKINSSTAVNLDYLNNADGRNLGNKIFTFSYWGKTSRSAEDKTPISAVQNEFEDLGNGWYRASCRITIPDEISMLRSFEIANVKGNWQSLEIRKHRIRLLSDTITEAKYSDGVTLATLVYSQASTAKLKELELKEAQESVLLKEKRDLEAKIAAYNAKEETRAKIEELRTLIERLNIDKVSLWEKYVKEENNPFNYYCYLWVKVGNSWKGVHIENQSDSDNTALVRYKGNGNIFRFKSAGNDNYYLEVEVGNSWKEVHIEKQSDSDNTALVRHQNKGNIFRFKSAGNDNYYLEVEVRNSWKGVHIKDQSDSEPKLLVRHRDKGNLFEFKKDRVWTDDIILAYQKFKVTIEKVTKATEEYNSLQEGVQGSPKDLSAWEDRIRVIEREISTIQTNINSLNTDLLGQFKNTQAKPQAMPLVAKDGQGLVTQGALLGFVQPASRLSAIETCEGNVQLSYFDIQGRMRQTNYDATADSQNGDFEQWIPDDQRACLNFHTSSPVKLNTPLYLPDDWSIEAWFVHPLPKTTEWNTLTRGKDGGHHVVVRNGKQLGIYLKDNVQSQYFFDSGFNMELLTQGWHHLTVVGKEDTTLFYIDGKQVGDIKAKALKDAGENLNTNPNDAAAKKKVEDIKKASLKVSGDVYTIGGNQVSGDHQFGKVAEVGIWGVALTDEEIAINSKTLLSGNEPGLLAYYPMNEATEEEVRDHSGNGHNGTVSGANWWVCTAPIGNPGNTVMKFDGVNDYVEITDPFRNIETFTISAWIKPAKINTGNYQGLIGKQYDQHRKPSLWISPNNGGLHYDSYTTSGEGYGGIINNFFDAADTWFHVAWVKNGTKYKFYKNGEEFAVQDAPKSFYTEKKSGYWLGKVDTCFPGQIADVRIWDKARTQAEIQADMNKRLTGKEPNLVAYYPLNEIILEGTSQKVQDLTGNHHGIVKEAVTAEDNTLPIGGDALVCAEYSTVTVEPSTKRKAAIMRRFLACPTTNGAILLPDKRVEALELKWIGNGQFQPTLLGYIEGPPPVPSENLTVEDDYNGATSVELTMSEDVAFSWNRSQDSGLGATIDTFAGAGGTMSILTAPLGVGSSIDTSTRVGYKANFDSSYQFLNESNITSSFSLSMTDKLELRGTPEESPKFPDLGTRFVPKNIGYALVVSAISDVFVTRLARSGKMVGYQVQPVDGIPPDVNTITFLINPAYTMNGSLDGLTGSNATSDRFFKHIPEMRSQYGSLYPASYYRLQEAYDLKRAIEAEDKRRESYFSNFDVRTIDETSLDRNIDSGDAPTTIGVQREEDKPSTEIIDEESKEAQDQKAQQFQTNTAGAADRTTSAAQAKQAEIKSKINDQEQRVQATESFASWQKRMESIQIRGGKRNIVNTYVWDADGGLRTEQQSFANTVEHTIGGSFSMNAGFGVDSSFSVLGVDVELTAQATVNLTQTMNKTEARSKGFELNVDLSGLEHKGITDYKDRPILPGEKVDRYRFMSFYLESSTQNFHDFFSYVVDPEWLQSNDEEARALRQAQAGKPNKTWRVLHRVTYVERPALMGFGRDVRKVRDQGEISESQQLLDKITKLEADNRELQQKVDQILNHLEQSK
ncbi:LamG domain-containing protein [Chrysosporum ovalisporum APH033B]|uniref:LamG domain-containing protein n=1 Tax=Umezakia ovalisporum TaxID=75695 RepID=UPI002474030F|nr:LamG domain-containing protein [Umezakia ovalisporum]MDH6068056.1 LamG domain-containing protein [Umezakia ovalisporum APH033B]MDH6078361.1 LamG domain-containing protein [Umezakia ovalisporum FSS-45]